MDTTKDISGYIYQSIHLNHSHEYLSPPLVTILNSLRLKGSRRRVFDLGCGNGAVANELSKLGYDVIGIDPSEQGISLAKRHYPSLKIEQGSAYDDLAAQYGRFPAVISLEVVEHVYFPRKYAATLFELVEEGGTAIISTPYHGYWKNLALALTGKMDSHFTALWDNGHIKFWSFRTLRVLLEEAGFQEISFQRVGRIPALAKSMIAVARKSKK